MKKRLVVGFGALVVMVALTAGAFWAGWTAGTEHPRNITITDASSMQPPAGTESVGDMTTFWQAWQTINDEYLKNPEISGADKVSGAIKGLVGSLKDPYSEFFTAQEAKKFFEDVRGNFGGIGAELGRREGRLTVIAPIKGTPAEKAGILAGDIILQVYSSSTQDITVDEAVTWIRGPVGTEIELSIFREGWSEARDFKLTRAVIQIPTLDLTMRGDIAHVELYSFNINAEPLFAEAVREAAGKGAKGMILDLRNNPGGYLDVAVNLAGWFLPKGALVVSEEFRTMPRQELHANGNALLADFPVVVLMNGGSASASEILAGALRDDRGVKLVGEKSFGKGAVQETFPILGDASLKLTVAHWVLPSGHILEGEGLAPDFEVVNTPEDLENDRDPQLDKALEILKSETSR